MTTFHPGVVPPPAAMPAGRPRRRWARFWFVTLVLVEVAASVVLNVGLGNCVTGTPAANGSYAPQLSRNAEWTGSMTTAYTNAQIQTIATNDSYFLIPKFANNYDIQAQFADVRKIVAAAKAHGNDIKVFLYFNASFWFDVNTAGWKPYSNNFKTSYYLRDDNGQTIPYFGLRNSQTSGDDAKAYMVDLTNAAYRSYAVATITAWMKAAPISGIVFDSANPFIGSQTIRKPIGPGSGTANDLLCPASATTDAAENCSRVTAWNDGLASLLSASKAALEPLGGQVIYNGVAANSARIDRNVALLDDASGASNESFCYNALQGQPDTVQLTTLTDDLTMMRTQAEAGKKLIEITNYTDKSRWKYSSYCLGGFLMGWQPGSSFWIYHANYQDPLTTWPVIPEQNLNLGDPTTTGYTTSGDVLSRTFQRGFVAVNSGSGSATVTLPAALDQMSGGRVVAHMKAGSTMTLAAHTGAFFLNANLEAAASAPAARTCTGLSF